MMWLIEYWYVLFSVACLMATAIFMFVVFWNYPREKKLAALREWLKGAVSEAEEALGSGTGELKLRRVYDRAIERFPWVATIYDFERFSLDVKKALEWMKKQIEQNKDIKKLLVKESEQNG